MDLATYLRQERRRLGLTQKEAAERAGKDFDAQYFSDWENSRGLPEPARMPAVIAALELNPWRAWTLWIQAKVPGYELAQEDLDPSLAAALRSQAAHPGQALEIAQEMGRRANPPDGIEAPRRGRRRAR